jgi:ABC-type phosphate transport system substrate-binding protein
MKLTKTACALASAVGVIGAGAQVRAQGATPPCSDTTAFPNPVYMAGSSAFEPTLARLALKLAAQTPPVTVIYKTSASCDGANVIVSAGPLTGNADYYAPNPAISATSPLPYVIKNCTLDPDHPTALIGVADVAFQTCIGTPPPVTIGEYTGPIQAMLFVVPAANKTTTAISAEQAAAIYGCGVNSGVPPFTDITAIQQRNSTSGTQRMIAAYIGVDPTAWQGNQNSKSGDMVNSLLAVTTSSKAIGILAADVYASPPNPTNLNMLAFRGFNQTKAYYADSAPGIFDKKNVRDGHYMIQGPLHFFTTLTAGQPTAQAKQMLDWLQGNGVLDPANPNAYIDLVTAAGAVPNCAMKVRRDVDGGYLTACTPAVSCGCYFETVATKTTPAGCKPCTSNADCTTAGTTCQTGYCE